jgi:hypothetical protein
LERGLNPLRLIKICSIVSVTLLPLLRFMEGTEYSLPTSPIKPYYPVQLIHFRRFSNRVSRGRDHEDQLNASSEPLSDVTTPLRSMRVPERRETPALSLSIAILYLSISCLPGQKRELAFYKKTVPHLTN